MSPRPQLTAGPVLSQRVCATAQGPHGMFSFCVRFLFSLWLPWMGKNFTAASQTSSTLTSLSEIAQTNLAVELHNQSVKVRCLCSAYVKCNLPPRRLPPSACLYRCLSAFCSPCAVLETRLPRRALSPCLYLTLHIICRRRFPPPSAGPFAVACEVRAPAPLILVSITIQVKSGLQLSTTRTVYVLFLYLRTPLGPCRVSVAHPYCV